MAAFGEGLTIVDISKRFGDVQAVDGLSFEVARGSMFGFLGPNGAGKTTTMRSIVGMVRLDQGSIGWDGAEIGADQRRRIGYMPQERGLYARMKVLEQVVYFGRLAGLDSGEAHDRAAYWLERVGVTDRSNDLVQELSGGNQQRVQLAVALVHDPELLVLDEPFAGLDPVAADNLQEIISEQAQKGAAVLLSSHQLDLVADLCDEVVIVANGRSVASGSIDDIRDNAPVRVLRIRWKTPIAQWQPTLGSVQTFDGSRAVVELPADAEPTAIINEAMASGPIGEIAIEPPTLADLFSDLVTDPSPTSSETEEGATL